MSIYEFATFRLDPAERRLMHESSVVPLPAKAFDTLLVLVRNAGHLVDKEALMKAVWPDTFVEEGTLAQNVSTLRKALRERPNSPRFIETVPRRGYRFLAAVSEIHATPEESIQEVSGKLLDGGSQVGSAASHPFWVTRRTGTYASLTLMLAIALTVSLWIGRSASRDVSYEQLTNFTDSASYPILSPDGRMLAFVRSQYGFLSDGQIWVKMLPDGEPVQLTRESLPLSTPVFSPDGSYIAYTLTDVRTTSWDTWIVPVLGGNPRRLLSNATGLTWIGDRRVLFSEIKSGMHMGIVTAAENRSDVRSVYAPAHERAMAHYSYLSPDREWVLVAEMDPTWLQCRVVPFDGSSMGRTVGPVGACTAAAWSPDGRWMYFVATVDGESHLWRQRFPDGMPEQMTFGPTEEEGIAVAPDGSLITAVGLRQGVISIQGPDGERDVSSQGDASRPSFSVDGRKVYYLLRPQRSSPTNELWVTDLVTGESEPLITGFSIVTYDVSSDENLVVLETNRPGGESEIWVAPPDRRTAPGRIADSGETPFFGPAGEVVFKASEGNRNYLYKTGADRSGRLRVIEQAISNVFSHSPDGKWTIVLAPNPDGEPAATMLAIPVAGGAPLRVCSGGCLTDWSPDGKFFQIAFHPTSLAERADTFMVPLAPGEMLPALPPSGFVSGDVVAALPDVRRFARPGSVPGVDSETYAFVRPSVHKNLYRISLP